MTAAQPDQKQSGALASLFKPLQTSAVILDDEESYYAERQHPAALIQPFFETFVFLLFVLLIVDLQDGNLNEENRVVVVILLIAVAIIVIGTITGGRPTSRLAVDPFTNAPSANPALKWVVPILLVLSFFVFGLAATLVISVVVVILRMVTFAARWAFYERRYVTNRRLVEASGFLGSRVASMPLSRVTDVVFQRTIPAELLSYAHMRVETAGQDQALGRVRFITNPEKFYDALSTLSAPISAAAGDIEPD